MSDDPEGYHEHDGKAYCRPCYVELFAPYCRGCNKPIVDKICVTALNSKYHQDCFVCRVGALFNIEILIFSLNPNKYRHSLSLSFTVSLRVTFPISPLSLYLFLSSSLSRHPKSNISFEFYFLKYRIVLVHSKMETISNSKASHTVKNISVARCVPIVSNCVAHKTNTLAH